jgi:predicted glycosyltransferase
MIVDKRPAGIDGELLETIQRLKVAHSPVKLVLGVRDILDEPVHTRKSLKKANAFSIIERYYDEVWIYGVPTVFDPVTEYQFPAAVAQKTVFCGYLQRPTATAVRGDGPPRVLVTTGGGGDGSDVIEAYLEGLLDLPRRTALRSTILFGPEMPAHCQASLLARYGHLTDATFSEFEADLAPHYARSDLVVAMAGYNPAGDAFGTDWHALRFD